ncbi:MAG: hypothetical protein HQL87_06070 [Magnetococcales bacterium]|nr:hypothetical protein [Magnetococcales bacterium]
MPAQADIIPFHPRKQVTIKSGSQPSETVPFRTLLEKQVAVKSGTQPSFQPLLFPYFDHRLVVLVNIETITGSQLLDLVAQSNPSVIFDLRICPRFDLEGINRSSFFKTLQDLKIKYFDLAAMREIQTSDDPKLYPLTAARLISDKLSSLRIDGPLLVFLSHSQHVLHCTAVFPSLLKPIPKKGWDIYPYQ